LVEQFSSTIVQWNEYLVAGGQVVGVRFERSDGTAPVRYFHGSTGSPQATIWARSQRFRTRPAPSSSASPLMVSPVEP
jgi:hypothetical protein